jgi:hypothetical protein
MREHRIRLDRVGQLDSGRGLRAQQYSRRHRGELGQRGPGANRPVLAGGAADINSTYPSLSPSAVPVAMSET